MREKIDGRKSPQRQCRHGKARPTEVKTGQLVPGAIDEKSSYPDEENEQSPIVLASATASEIVEEVRP